MKLVRWGVSLVLAAFMGFMGSQKFGASNAVFQYLAEKSGFDLFEPVVRLAVGSAELLAAVLIIFGLFLATVRGLGFALSLIIIGGAIGFHMSPWLGIEAPIGFDRAVAYIFSPALFFMALAFFALSVLGTFLERDALFGRLAGE